jgi:2-polyprenyl-3-methyl-5-hydroxy-6-metoxy-1,4-benzoquinol methylase
MPSNSTTAPRCVICEEPLLHIGEDFTGKQIFKCVACDFVMTPISSAADTAALYDDPEYFDGWGCNLEFDYDRFDPSVHRQISNYLEFINAHTKGKSLLDVGTGSGLLPHLARTRGYDVEGTDLSRHVSKNVPVKAGFPIHQGALEEIQFTHKYDIITMLHVLEHTSNPLTTLRRCRELLNGGGYLVVVVPNYQSLDSRLKDLLSKLKLKSRPYKHLALGHHNYVFSLKSLERLGRQAGFETIRAETGQPAWRAGRWHRLLEHRGAAAWCWVVYKRVSSF